ncbi:MAG: carbon-nitrogen hydrolase family protein [Gemmatimonadota bacterium]
MKVAAYQAPLATSGIPDTLALIREQVARCEDLGVEILCCPEAILGGLADYAPDPFSIAISIENGDLDQLLSPLTSKTVTTILGLTEIDRQGRLFNAAVIWHCGTILGHYRKLHPFIRKSVYQAGSDTPVFTARGLTFGIVICRDSTFPEPARAMASKGATAIFIPTNCGLPVNRANPKIVEEARSCDVAMARENGVCVVRADVAGETAELMSYGASGLVDQGGRVLCSAREHQADLIFAEISTM